MRKRYSTPTEEEIDKLIEEGGGALEYEEFNVLNSEWFRKTVKPSRITDLFVEQLKLWHYKIFQELLKTLPLDTKINQTLIDQNLKAASTHIQTDLPVRLYALMNQMMHEFAIIASSGFLTKEDIQGLSELTDLYVQGSSKTKIRDGRGGRVVNEKRVREISLEEARIVQIIRKLHNDSVSLNRITQPMVFESLQKITKRIEQFSAFQQRWKRRYRKQLPDGKVESWKEFVERSVWKGKKTDIQ